MTEKIPATIEPELLAAAERGLLELKSRLPENKVASLAREVISQVVGIALASSVESPSEEDIVELCQALTSRDQFEAADFINRVRAEGASIEAVYLKYLAAAARLLGDWWTDKRASFADVTIGTSRIYGIIRGLRRHPANPINEVERSAVFASVPGETHTLGIVMAADMFRRDGWDIELRVGLEQKQLVEEIKRLAPDFIGLSVSGRHSLGVLSRLVIALQISSAATPILVAGQSIEELEPEIELMGVEGIVKSIDEALKMARNLNG